MILRFEQGQDDFAATDRGQRICLGLRLADVSAGPGRVRGLGDDLENLARVSVHLYFGSRLRPGQVD